MPSKGEQAEPVKTKAVLIDPESKTVLWMNEAAAQDVSDKVVESASGLSLDQAVPIGELLGVPEALSAAVKTGLAQHLQTELVSTAKGTMLIVASVYPLPDGKLLLLTEHGWQARRFR